MKVWFVNKICCVYYIVLFIKKGERCYIYKNYFNLLIKVNREFVFILIFLYLNGVDIKFRINLIIIFSIVKKIEYLSLFFIFVSLIKV